MGACGYDNNEISFTCNYEIRYINRYIQIINNAWMDNYIINREISSKIKILENDKKK